MMKSYVLDGKNRIQCPTGECSYCPVGIKVGEGNPREFIEKMSLDYDAYKESPCHRVARYFGLIEGDSFKERHNRNLKESLQ